MDVHQMGEASQGISCFLSKETRLFIMYTGIHCLVCTAFA